MADFAHPNDPHEQAFAGQGGRARCVLLIDDGALLVSWPGGDYGCPWPAPVPLNISRLDPVLLEQLNAHLAEYAHKERMAGAQDRALASPANRDVLRKLADK